MITKTIAVLAFDEKKFPSSLIELTIESNPKSKSNVCSGACCKKKSL